MLAFSCLPFVQPPKIKPLKTGLHHSIITSSDIYIYIKFLIFLCYLGS